VWFDSTADVCLAQHKEIPVPKTAAPEVIDSPTTINALIKRAGVEPETAAQLAAMVAELRAIQAPVMSTEAGKCHLAAIRQKLIAVAQYADECVQDMSRSLSSRRPCPEKPGPTLPRPMTRACADSPRPPAVARE
jgi:hypothetical protein